MFFGHNKLTHPFILERERIAQEHETQRIEDEKRKHEIEKLKAKELVDYFVAQDIAQKGHGTKKGSHVEADGAKLEKEAKMIAESKIKTQHVKTARMYSAITFSINTKHNK